MKENTSGRVRLCPKCGKTYCGVPALSRADNSPICPDCGIREALDSIEVSLAEQEKILAAIHRSNAQ